MSFQSDNGIYYLYPYYPTRYVEHKGISEDIIAFKNGDPNLIDKFSKEMKEALSELFKNYALKPKETCLVVVPSHLVGKWSKSLLKLARKLCQELNMANYSCALERVVEHEKLASGGNRSIDSHINTMKLNPIFNMEGKTVIILDDVTTTGNSFYASREIIMDAGAKCTIAIAIGKTFTGTY